MYKNIEEEYNHMHDEVFHYMALLGYKEIEIKEAIEWFNLHHLMHLYTYQLPLIIGKLVQIIEKGEMYYETY